MQLMMIRKRSDSSELGRRPAKYYHMHNLVMDDHYEFLALVGYQIDRVRAVWAYMNIPGMLTFADFPNHRTAADLIKKNALL